MAGAVYLNVCAPYCTGLRALSGDFSYRQTVTCWLDVLVSSVPELANFGGKQHPIDIIFPLFPSNFTMNFPLSISHPLKI